VKQKPEDKPWMKGLGALRHLHEENVRIQQIVDEEFEQIELEDWDDIDPTAPSQSRFSNEC
jgi:hypothetical protein